MNEPICKTFMM